jgi:beta-galactosidase
MTWLWLALGCSPAHIETDAPDVSTTGFPDDFKWGSATAGFQVDMGCPTWSEDDCDDKASDWYQWVTTPSVIADSSLWVSGEPVSAGPGMWETFEADVALMKSDGHSAYRMSMEWSRLFPDGAAETATTVDELTLLANADAAARYHEMFDALKQANIEPVVTLNHYTLPLWVHDGVACHNDLNCEASGWVNGERIVRLISLYAGYCAREFGTEVDTWATLNEPFATTLSGYTFPGEDRSSPPGRNLDVAGSVAVMLHQIEGHAAMYDAVHAEDDTASVGIVMNMTSIQPEDADNPDHVLAAEHMDYLYHGLYLNALTAGDWDPNLDGTVDETRPDLAHRLDFIGINYYNRVDVRLFPIAVVTEIPIFDFYPEFSWDPYPEGLGHVVTRAAEYGLPIWVTENGTPFVEERGVEVLDGHLLALHKAIASGADVRGYLYWSFVDNYEWNHGFDLRFGLYELDPDTKERRPRAVRDRLKQAATSNALPQ